MRRLFAISMLAILAFNFCGYRLLINFLQNQEQSVLEGKLDAEHYDEQQLISIKTPLHLPYYSSTDGFERAVGSITLNGVEYEYVKRRIYRDTLELLCLPNHEKMKLAAAVNEILKRSLDGSPAESNKKTPATIKLSAPDFFQEAAIYMFFKPEPISALPMQVNETLLLKGFSNLPERPPCA